ncbi:MAG: AsmA family protein, partial [Mariprofundus sp.]|nr:AsmA family protein [Mariprofundus sp.]
MAKVIRYSLIILSLLIVALLAAPFLIDVNVYKNQIERTVEDATGRKLSIGNMDASLFPWVGVQLENVHLANRAGFSERDFLSVERLHVKLALLPLLSKNIEIKHFEMVMPSIYLQRLSTGENNWDDLIAAPDNLTDQTQSPASDNNIKTISAAPAAPALAALQADSLSLTGGKVTWVDADAAPLILSELDVLLDDVQLERPVKVRISGKLSGNAFALDANIGPVGKLSALDVTSLPLQGAFKADNIQLQPFQHLISAWPEQLGELAGASVRVSAKLEQRPNGIRLSEGELHVNAAHTLGLSWKVEMSTTDQLKINQLALAVNGKSMLDIKGTVQHVLKNPSFNLRLHGYPIERTWLENFIPDLNAMYAAHPAAWKQLQFSAVLAGSSKQLDIRDLQLKLDQELLQISGAVTYAEPDIRLRMHAKQLHLDAWLPQGEDETAQANQLHWPNISLIHGAIAAPAKKVAAVEPDLRFLKNWKINSQLKVKTLWVRGMEMGDFSATIKGSRGQIKLSPLSFKLAGGKVTEKASLNVRSYPVKWKESVHISHVQAGPLLKTLADMDMLEGSMDMDTKLYGTGLTPAAIRTLNGRGTILFQNGKLKGFDIAGAIRKYTNPKAYQEGPKETDFAQLSGSFDIKNGIAVNRDLFMASPLLRITGKGKINLVNKTLDYEVKPRVVGTLKGQGSTFLRRGLSIPLHIYGPFESPKIKPIINAKTLLQ